MSFWVLTAGCQVVSRTTVQRVTNLERQTQDIIERCQQYDLQVAPRLGDPDYHDPDGNGKTNPRDWEKEFELGWLALTILTDRLRSKVSVKILAKTVRYLASPGIAWLRRKEDRYT